MKFNSHPRKVRFPRIITFVEYAELWDKHNGYRLLGKLLVFPFHLLVVGLAYVIYDFIRLTFGLLISFIWSLGLILTHFCVKSTDTSYDLVNEIIKVYEFNFLKWMDEW